MTVEILPDVIEKLSECVVDAIYKIDWDKAIEAYKARATGKWIPVSERLPKENGYYLVTTDGSHTSVIDIAEYRDAIRKSPDGSIYTAKEWNKASEVLAWQSLPQPYKEAENEQSSRT